MSMRANPQTSAGRNGASSDSPNHGIERDDELDAARIDSRQLPIFARDAKTAFEVLDVGIDEWLWLREAGLLSFDPQTAGLLDESREAEVAFLGSLLAAGCSRESLPALLQGLRKPYAYDLQKTYYDWPRARWSLFPESRPVEDAFLALLERLPPNREVELLLAMREWIEAALDLIDDRGHLLSHEMPARA